ncbi:MAG: hypothetical protein KDA84_11055, partial [Planctomycetaceae bacterium]|nr:hypothetical protein [Planctomycetaceae bacterium]
GRPEVLVFEGLQSFPAEQVRQVLGQDFDIVLASNTHADLETYLRTLEQRLTEGFRKNGFPAPKVKAQLGKEVIRIQIEEGKRYFNAGAQVIGPGDLDRELMVKHLTDSKALQALVDQDSVLEKETNPVKKLYSEISPRFGETSKSNPGRQATDFFCDPKKKYSEAIETAFAAQGYFFPEYAVELETTESDKAYLQVRIKDTGPKAVIGQITVDGLKHHTSAELLTFLGIQPGMQVDHQQKTKWEEKLKESPCFLKSRIAVLPAIAPDAPSELLIRVVEQPNGPFLGDKLTQHDQLLSKTAQWMGDWEKGDAGDLMIALRTTVKERGTGRLLAAISPKEGIAVDVELLPTGQ